MNRHAWTVEEDDGIIRLVMLYGVLDWTNIAEKLKQLVPMTKRTGKQCRERWYNHLSPDVNKKPWTEEEEQKLFEIHRKSGNRWKSISTFFQGRTDNDIKNHFYSTLRRSLRRLNKFIGEKNSTTQMREIKPSVLSTIMNYIYEQQIQQIQNNEDDKSITINALKDLPYLIFQFSNFKPVKVKLRDRTNEEVKQKISFIFQLITQFNVSYKKLKLSNKSQRKVKKVVENNDVKLEQVEKDQGGYQKLEMKTCDTVNNQTINIKDINMYIPRRQYTSLSGKSQTSKQKGRNVLPSTLIKNNNQKNQNRNKNNNTEIIKLQVSQQQQLQQFNPIKTNRYSHLIEQKHLATTLLHSQNQSIKMLMTSMTNDHQMDEEQSEQEQQENEEKDHRKKNMNSEIDNMMEQLNGLRTRRISLQAYDEQFDEDEEMWIEEPSKVSQFCQEKQVNNNNNNNNNMDLLGLVVIGKQIPIHYYPSNRSSQKKNIQQDNYVDELIEMNYTKPAKLV